MTDTDHADAPLRIGVLGAARITALALVSPARITGARLVAVAARDRTRAEAFAAEHGVERVVDTYQDLLDDPEVEAVYNPLPNGLHGTWSIRALQAGNHVLGEKPSAANGEEARALRDAARRAGTVYMEAFHYPYHPLYRRVVELVADGAIGEVQRVDSALNMPDPGADDPRWRLDLAGGSTMDLGCYSLSAVRLLGVQLAELGGAPRVTAARAREWPAEPGVDEELRVDLEYPSGVTAIGGSWMNAPEWDFHLDVHGSAGSIHVPFFPLPHQDDSLVLSRPGQDDVVEHLGTRSSYTYQLEAFAAAVRDRAPVLTDADWAVDVMDLIDDAYRAAGLEPRRPTAAGGR